MPLTFDENGLAIQTFDEILGEVQDDFRDRIASDIATNLQSAAGQMQRIIAKGRSDMQQKVQQLFQSLDSRLAEGAHLDIRLGSNLGVTRLEAQRAEVLGTVTTTASVTLLDGTRVSVGGFVFEIINGPYSRVGAGTITDVRVRSQIYDEIDVSALGAWTIVDAVAGWSDYDDVSQPIAGRSEELDAAYRARAEIERFRRAMGPLNALDANVLAVDGVTYAKSWHNVDPSSGDPNSDGIPLYAINVVVEGGDDEAVATAIEEAGPAATRYFGTDATVTLGSGVFQRDVSFDRVAEVTMWIRATITTSTSEETPLDSAALEAAVQTAFAAEAAANWTIGADIVPIDLSAALVAAGIPAMDAILIELSTDDGGTDPYTSAKETISIRQRAAYADARVTVVEN